MDAETRWRAIETERLTLADLLESLGPEQWETPSLCAEWRVRDVAAHVAMAPVLTRMGPILLGVARARGRLWDYGRDVAIEWAQRPTAEIVETLRAEAGSRALPPVTNAKNILMDAVVHGQDIAVPLGIDRRAPTASAVAAFERVWSSGWPFWARRRLRGLRVVATDAPVDEGEGPVVEGRLTDLLLLCTGRTEAAVARLHGPGLAQLTSSAS